MCENARVKRCTVCGEEKPLDCFYGAKQARDGLMSRCKECHKAKVREYEAANPEKRAKWGKTHRARHADKIRERQREWQQGAGREKYLAIRKRYREAHPDRIKAAWAEWFAENGEARREMLRAVYDPAERRLQRNPEQSRRDRERRRARMLDAYVEDTPFDDVLLRDCGVCGICHEPIMENTIEIDHVIPLAQNGEHSMKNVQLAHRSCNRRKAARVDFTLAA